MDSVLDKFMQLNHLNATPDNMRNFFSQVRGLSIATLNLPQRLKTQRPHILEEGAQWLHHYPDEISRLLRSLQILRHMNHPEFWSFKAGNKAMVLSKPQRGPTIKIGQRPIP